MPNCVAENRVGTFDLPEDVVEEQPSIVMKIMARCVVVRCEHHYHQKAMRYVAFSPDFEEADKAVDPPSYDIEVSDAEEISWVKRD